MLRSVIDRSASSASGDVPSGFSLDDSLTKRSRPYFLRACETVVPGVYGLSEATCGRTSARYSMTTLAGMQEPAAGFRDRIAGRALRTAFRFERLDGKVEQRGRGDAEIDERAAHDRADPGDGRAAGAHDVDDLAHRAAGRHDVLDDERAVVRLEREAAAEGRDAVLFLDEDAERAELARRLVAEHDPADRRADDDRRRERARLVGERARDLLDEPRIFEDAELLDEPVRVPAGREPKVPVEDRAALLELAFEIERRRVVHPRSSARIARAAATGSASSVIGRPTTA